jgi:O-antigen ligase
MITVLVACAVGAGLLRAAMLPLDRRVDRLRLPDRSRIPVVAGAVAVGLIAVIVGALAFHVPSTVSAKADEFSAKNEENVGGGGGRLLSANANGRKEHWEIALDTYHREPLHGSGAGTFGLEWAKGRNGLVHVEDAHSLYIEALGELGLVGFILLVSTGSGRCRP